MSNAAGAAAGETTRPSRRRRFTVDALFADTTPRAVGVTDLVSAKEIRLDRIVPDADQPRRTFDEERLEELAASIQAEGVLQPIAVRYDEEHDRYVVLHGERRWRAATMAGLETIPAIVRDVPEERRLLQQLMENVVREDLNAVDRAAALRVLKTQMGDASWERVADAVGIKRSRLFQLLGTEKLPETVQDQIRAGRLSEKQSRVLQGLAPGPQATLASLIVDEGLGQREAQRLARAVRDDPEIAALAPDALTERLRAMREVIDDRAAERRQRPAADPLHALFPGGVTAADGEPITAEAVHAQVSALAYSLARLSTAAISRRDRRALDNRLRMLRELITSALDSSGVR